MTQIIILSLNFIYIFSFLVTTALIVLIINDLFLFFSYEDNIYYTTDDYVDTKIDRLDYIYEELFEFDIYQYEFSADEVLDADLEHIQPYLKNTPNQNNNLDDFHGYFSTKLFSAFHYLELVNTTKLFFNNEGLLLFFIVFIYNTVEFFSLIVVFFLIFYFVLFFQHNNFFNFKKFINLNSPLKSEKGFLNYDSAQLDTTNKDVGLTEFVGSSDHYTLTQQSSATTYNFLNYFPNSYSKTNLILLLNNNVELNFNYLINFINSKENTTKSLNVNLINFLIYYNVLIEWKRKIKNNPLLRFENSNETNKVELPLPTLATNEFVKFTTTAINKQLIFSNNNVLLINNKVEPVTLKFSNNLNFTKLTHLLPDASTEQLKGDYGTYYSCLSDETFDSFFDLIVSFLKLNDIAFYSTFVNQHCYHLPVARVERSFLTTTYTFKSSFYELYYFNSFTSVPTQFYLNNYFNFFTILNLHTNSTLTLQQNKKINVTIFEQLVKFNISKSFLDNVWSKLLLNLTQLRNLPYSYKVELSRIFNYPYHNKFYLKLSSDTLKLKIYNFLFSSQIPNFVLINFNNFSTSNLNIIIKKNKFLRQTFKKFFKFDFLLKAKRKKYNKKIFTKKKFFYYFWIQIINKLKLTTVKTVALNHLFFDKQFLNLLNFNIKENLTKLNIILATFLSPTRDCFYNFLTKQNCNFYYNSILTNKYYQKLRMNFLNYTNWVNFFNSINVVEVANFLNLPQNKLVNVKDLKLNNIATQTGAIFLNCVQKKPINFSKLFFLKNLYKKLFFENNYYKFDGINNFNDYFFYIRKIFLLIFKFELNSIITYLTYNNLFNTKVNYSFKRHKQVALIKSHLFKTQPSSTILIEPNYTSTLLNAILTDNSFMFNNFYNSIINYHIFNDTNFTVLDKVVAVKLLTKLGIKINLPTNFVKLSYLVNKLNFVDFITVLNYTTGSPTELLTSSTFYSDNILNPASVAYESFIWVDNEEDVFSYIPEDGILLEDHTIDNEFDEEGYAELGLVDFSLELNADLVEDNFKKSLKDDYGYVSFFPYKIKIFSERFLFFNYFKQFVTFKKLKLYLPYHSNWGYLTFSFFKIIIVVTFRNLYYLFSYKILLLFIFILAVFLL